MKVTFTYQTSFGGAGTTPLVLSLGQRHSPLAPMEFAHTGVAQASHPVRAQSKTFFGRGGGDTMESFIAQKEHTDYWAGVVWTRVTLNRARGMNGTLTFEGDRGGRVRLVDCVLTNAEAAPGLVGMTSFVRFSFIGGSWEIG